MSLWRNLDEREATQLGRELLRELAEGHPLRGRPARAVARRDDCDDVAFDIDGVGLCVVHLTWAREPDAQWPRFEFVQTLPDDDA
jgi:hypothetical protein